MFTPGCLCIRSYDTQVRFAYAWTPTFSEVPAHDTSLSRSAPTCTSAHWRDVLQDNYDVLGLATTAGSVSLVDNFPAADAAQVLRRVQSFGTKA